MPYPRMANGCRPGRWSRFYRGGWTQGIARAGGDADCQPTSIGGDTEMTTYLKRTGLALAMAPITLALLLTGGDARANITIAFGQVGSNVVETGSGAIDLTGLHGPNFFAQDGASGIVP